MSHLSLSGLLVFGTARGIDENSAACDSRTRKDQFFHFHYHYHLHFLAFSPPPPPPTQYLTRAPRAYWRIDGSVKAVLTMGNGLGRAEAAARRTMWGSSGPIDYLGVTYPGCSGTRSNSLELGWTCLDFPKYGDGAADSAEETWRRVLTPEKATQAKVQVHLLCRFVQVPVPHMQ